jgi:DNA-binding beta-propeller fold protein YncE
MKSYFLLLSLAAIFSCSSFVNGQSNYQLVNKIPVKGEGGWDYISADDGNYKIFISHSTVAQVLDLKTGQLAGTIPNTNGIHGIAIATSLNKGFTSNGKDSSVTVFDLKTLKVLATIKVTGANPDCILYDAFSQKVFTFNGRSANATVIDANENKVVATIPLDGKPEFSVTDGKGQIYVNIEDKSVINVINTNTLTVVKHWPIAPGEEPSGLALDNKNHRLFSVCGNKLMVVTDADSGKVITTLPIGDRCDGVAFDPKYLRAFSSNGEGTITVVQEIDANNFKVLETVKTQPGARTITLDKATHHLYLPTAEFRTPVEGQRRPPVKPNSFVILDVATLK